MEIQLTKAEEQFMQVLWNLEEASVQDIIDQLPEPKPAYNTVSTIIRILENKILLDTRQREGVIFIFRWFQNRFIQTRVYKKL